MSFETQPIFAGDLRQAASLANSSPLQREWWAFEQRAYPLGGVPEDALLKAFQSIAQTNVRSSTLSSPAWVNLGPAPIQTPSGPYSGSVADIAVNPNDSNDWMIGTAGGGVWETRDAGLTWTPRTDDQASLATGAIAFAPSNPNVIYVGTGNLYPTGFAGRGLLKSTDAEVTWQQLAVGTFRGAVFVGMKVDPSNPDTVIAGTTLGFAGKGVSSLPNYSLPGIYKSIDGGKSWTLELHGYASDTEVSPATFNDQYAGLGTYWNSQADPSVPNGLYRSTDAGTTWKPIAGPWTGLSGGIGRVAVAIAPSNPNTAYVSMVDAVDTVGNDGQLLGIWRTDTAWAPTPSWVQIPSPDSSQWWYTNKPLVDANNANVLYAGGIRLWKFDGVKWTDLTQNLHLDQHAMVWLGSTLIVGNDGGVYSTADGGTTWTNHNTNLSITQFYEGSIRPTNPNFALAGSQDNGVEKWTGSNAWQLLFGCDGAHSEISSANPDTDWAVSCQELFLLRTRDGGTSFSRADSGIDKSGVPFIADFAKCPANDNVFIAGTNNLWKSLDFFSASAPSWISNGPEMGDSITAVTFASSDATCKTYAFGTQDGWLRITTDGGTSWADLDPANAVPNRWVTELAFDPTNADVLYVTLSGFDEGTPGQPGHVFRGSNLSAPSPSWSNVSPPVNMPHNAIVLDPSDPNTVFVGTDLGVWMSTNAGGTWVHQGPETGMPNVPVFDLQINSYEVVAFTFGRGAFVFRYSSPLAVSPLSASPTTAIPGQPVSFSATATDANGYVLSYTLAFGDGSSATGTTPAGGGPISATHVYATNGVNSAVLAVSDGHGAAASSSTSVTIATSLLRVTTSPAVPGKILVDGVPRDEWGLTWMKIAPGTHTVSFGGLNGWTTPAAQTVTTTSGATTTVTGNYGALGFLRVITNPAVASTISVNGVPRDDWGMWTALAPGTYTVHFGLVANYNPPADMSATVTAGTTTTITGNFVSNPSATGPDPTTYGLLRVTTNPATAAQILVNGVLADDWGLAWVKLAPGTYTVSFGQGYAYTPPAPQTVSVTAGATTTYNAVFTVHGSLRVTTNPALPATIFVNGVPRDDWGMWQSMPPGSYTVSFGPVAGYITPAPQTATVTAGTLTMITGTYVAAATSGPFHSSPSALEQSPGPALPFIVLPRDPSRSVDLRASVASATRPCPDE